MTVCLSPLTVDSGDLYWTVDIAEDAEDDDADLPPDMDMAIDNDVAMDASTPGAPQPLPALVQPLLALIQPTTLSFPPLAAPSPHPPTTSALSAIHVAALECLNNIFLALARSGGGSGSAADTAGGRAVWDAVWAALGAVGTQTGPGQERRRAMWEVAVGVLWGVASVYRGGLVRSHL
jgi:hypothetical protein